MREVFTYFSEALGVPEENLPSYVLLRCRRSKMSSDKTKEVKAKKSANFTSENNHLLASSENGDFRLAGRRLPQRRKRGLSSV